MSKKQEAASLEKRQRNYRRDKRIWMFPAASFSNRQ